MNLKCPHCRQQFMVPGNPQGSTVSCAMCGHRFIVPIDELMDEPPSAPARKSPQKAIAQARVESEDRFPNLSTLLASLDRSVELAFRILVGLMWFAALVLIVGGLSIAVADEDGSRIVAAVFGSIVLALLCFGTQALLRVARMVSLAMIESVKVQLQIERNTRK